MTSSPLDEGLLACAIERLLAGDAPPPRNGEFPFAPLLLLVPARTGRRVPRLQFTIHYRGDVRLTGLYRSLRLMLDAYAVTARRDRYDALRTLATQASTAFDYARECAADTGEYVDIDLELVSDINVLHREFKLVAGVLAGCLWECGWAEGREYVRGLVSELLQGADAHRYVTVAIGLQIDVGPLYWRPEQGSRGALRQAVSCGQALLDQASRGAPAAPARPLPVPAAEPAWATAAREKAAQDKAAAAALEAGPSLLVLATVEHLPGAARDGAERPGSLTGSTVRAEWAPFAGRPWPLLRVPDLAAAREVLVGEFPYAESIIGSVLGDLAGRPHVYVRPLLLVGAPGCGKTRLARRLAEVLGLGFQVYSVSGSSDASLIGTSRQWSTHRASVPLQMLKRLSMACGMLILDELDKAGTSKHNGSLLDAVLPLLTPDACRYLDPALECRTDLSAVSWIATANELDGLRRAAPALLDRFRIYTVPTPSPEHTPALLKGVMAELRAERGQDKLWCPDLTPDEAELITQHYQGGSVRVLRRLCEAVLAGRERLATRN